MRLSLEEVKGVMKEKLMSHGCDEKKAEKVAYEMARNSLEGTYTHGINRFARLIRNIDEGIVKPEANPEVIKSFGAMENVDGHMGLGIINAWFCMEEAIRLASDHGIGLAALRNTNHWLRAATYGYQACEAGMAGICFTNTMPNMGSRGFQNRQQPHGACISQKRRSSDRGYRYVPVLLRSPGTGQASGAENAD